MLGEQRHLHIDLTVHGEQTERVIGLLEEILTRFHRIERHLRRLELQGVNMTASQADVQAKLDALHDDVEAETNVVTSVETLLSGQTAMLVDLRKQLADAIAAGDPAALQATVDALDAITTTQVANRERVVAAVLANTPEQPPTTPEEPPTTSSSGRRGRS